MEINIKSLVLLVDLIKENCYDYDRAIIFLFISLLILFILRMTKEVAVTYLMCILSTLQWLIGPLIYFSEYNHGVAIEVAKMQVGKLEYFDFAFPSTIAFCIGLLLFQSCTLLGLLRFRRGDVFS